MYIYVIMDSMKVYEFRKDIKKHLDNALKGEEVIIERGGVDYRIVPSVTSKDGSFGFKPSTNRLINGVCKTHGTPLDSRGKCLMKGCKYS